MNIWRKTYCLKVCVSLILLTLVFRIGYGPFQEKVRVRAIEAIVSQPTTVPAFTNELTQMLLSLNVAPPYFKQLNLTLGKFRGSEAPIRPSSANIYLSNGEMLRLKIDASGVVNYLRYSSPPVECLILPAGSPLPVIEIDTTTPVFVRRLP